MVKIEDIKVGDLALVTCPGHPMWPAIMVDEKSVKDDQNFDIGEIDTNNLHSGRRTLVPVLFINDSSYLYVKPSQLKFLSLEQCEEFLNKYSNMDSEELQRAKIKKSMKENMEALLGAYSLARDYIVSGKSMEIDELVEIHEPVKKKQKIQSTSTTAEPMEATCKIKYEKEDQEEEEEDDDDDEEEKEDITQKEEKVEELEEKSEEGEREKQNFLQEVEGGEHNSDSNRDGVTASQLRVKNEYVELDIPRRSDECEAQAQVPKAIRENVVEEQEDAPSSSGSIGTKSSEGGISQTEDPKESKKHRKSIKIHDLINMEANNGAPDQGEIFDDKDVKVKSEYEFTLVRRKNDAEKEAELEKLREMTPIKFDFSSEFYDENAAAQELIFKKHEFFKENLDLLKESELHAELDPKYYFQYDPTPTEQQYVIGNLDSLETRRMLIDMSVDSGQVQELAKLSTAKLVYVIDHFKNYFEGEGSRFEIRLTTSRRVMYNKDKAKMIMQQVKSYRKKPRKSLGKKHRAHTAKATLKDMSEHLSLHESVVEELEFVVKQVAKMLDITLYGRVQHSEKTDTWMKKPAIFRNRIIGCLKRIFWDVFHFDGATIGMIVKRVARVTGHYYNYYYRVKEEDRKEFWDVVK